MIEIHSFILEIYIECVLCSGTIYMCQAARDRYKGEQERPSPALGLCLKQIVNK